MSPHPRPGPKRFKKGDLVRLVCADKDQDSIELYRHIDFEATSFTGIVSLVRLRYEDILQKKIFRKGDIGIFLKYHNRPNGTTCAVVAFGETFFEAPCSELELVATCECVPN